MFNRHTILLVEDNEDDVFIMQSAWRKADIPNPLQSVLDGELAISHLSGEGPYSDRARYPLPIVILLDLNMPKKNGFEVLEWLRQHPRLRRLTVHILTASTRKEDIDRAFDRGANGYLIKPSRVEALVDMLKAWHTLAQSSAFPLVEE
jgi:CheY-like chemotaxis protein